MKRMLSRLKTDEKGQAMILALIMLVIGVLLIAPLMGFMSTGLLAGQAIEEKVDGTYAAGAGVEDAIYNIIYASAPHYSDLQALAIGDSLPYNLTDTVNGLPVSVAVTKLSLIADFVDDSEYKADQPHEDWVTFDAPAEVDRQPTYVEYQATANFEYTGGGNRTIESIGFLFSPYPGDDSLIVGPNDIVYTPVIVADDLEATSPELVTGSGSFAFIWEWTQNNGPRFNSGDTGSLGFTFRIMDPGWEYSNYFIWATFKEQDISYVTNNPGSYNWMVEATAGDTTIRSYVLAAAAGTSVLTWEINP